MVAMSIFVIGIIASKARFASSSNQRQIVFFGFMCVCAFTKPIHFVAPSGIPPH